MLLGSERGVCPGCTHEIEAQEFYFNTKKGRLSLFLELLKLAEYISLELLVTLYPQRESLTKKKNTKEHKTQKKDTDS